MNQEQMSQSQSNQQNQPKKSLSISWVVFIATAVLILGLAGGYYYSNATQESEELAAVTPTQKPTSTSTVTVTASSAATPAFDEEKAKKELAEQLFSNDKEYGVDKISKGDDFYKIEKISEKHAEGFLGTATEDNGGGPGARWIAAKVKGKWEKVYTTQDCYKCEILWQYGFPSEIVSNCCIYSTDEGKTYEYIGTE